MKSSSLFAVFSFFVAALTASPSQAVSIKTLNDDLMCLALNGYYEARGEPPEGELLVNQVVLNRVNDGRFGDTVCDVIKEKASRRCQFDWVCSSGSKRPADPEAFERSLTLAQELLYRRDSLPDLTNGATYYHHKRVRPSWSRVFTKTLAYGSHIFYAND